MSLRRASLPIALFAGLLVFGAAGCGSDKDAGSTRSSSTAGQSTTTEKAATSESSTTTGADAGPTTSVPATTSGTGQTPTSPPTTDPDAVTDEVFAAALKATSDSLDAAGNDLCAILEVSKTADIPNPSTPNQVRLAVDYLERSFNALALALPPADKAAADALRATIVTLKQEASAANYDPSVFGAGSQSLRSAEFTAAMETIRTLTAKCPGSDTSTGTGG